MLVIEQCDSDVEPESRTRLLFAVCFLSIGISLLNIGLFYINTQYQWRLFNSGLLSSVASSISSLTHGNGKLERPNVYIGLDKLPFDVTRTSLPNSLVVYPPLFQPVDNAHGSIVYADDEHARFTFNGRVSPGDHHVLLTEHVSWRSSLRFT